MSHIRQRACWLIGLILLALAGTSMAEELGVTFGCQFIEGPPAKIQYSVLGGDGNPYIVEGSYSGCATLATATPDLTAANQTQEVQLNCTVPNSTGAVIVTISRDGVPLKVFKYSYSSNSSCALSGTCTEIPTLSEWAMIVFAALLLGLLTWYIVRRRRTPQTIAV